MGDNSGRVLILNMGRIDGHSYYNSYSSAKQIHVCGAAGQGPEGSPDPLRAILSP